VRPPLGTPAATRRPPPVSFTAPPAAPPEGRRPVSIAAQADQPRPRSPFAACRQGVGTVYTLALNAQWNGLPMVEIQLRCSRCMARVAALSLALPDEVCGRMIEERTWIP
jgi:hypothetical protein